MRLRLVIDVLIHCQPVQLAAQPGNRDIPGPQLGLVDGDFLAKDVTQVLLCGRSELEAVSAEAGDDL